METPRIKVGHYQGVAVVKLLDNKILDEITINDISDSLFSVVEDNAPVRMLLNFAKVEYLSSSMLGIPLPIKSGRNRS